MVIGGGGCTVRGGSVGIKNGGNMIDGDDGGGARIINGLCRWRCKTGVDVVDVVVDDANVLWVW